MSGEEADPHRIVLEPGVRVRVIRDRDWPGPWPAEPLGIIEPVMGEPHRIGTTTQGPVREFMVVFDEPQLDTDGDGPFEAAVIMETYLQPVGWAGVDAGDKATARRETFDAAMRAILHAPERGELRSAKPDH